ncbi:MAG: hypothetical protein WEB13_10750 [Dehalococcoidia bacterium]
MGPLVLVEGPCAHGGGFLRRACGRPAVGQCVYCGERFCADHGLRGEDYIEVCDRRACRAKLDDVHSHLRWRDTAAQSNRLSVCAQDECGDRMEHRCQRCRLMFCETHLRDRVVLDRSFDPPRRMPALLCAHCMARREIWD